MSTLELIQFLEVDLLSDASNFRVIKNSTDLNKPNIQLQNVIKLLQSTRSTQWYSIAISVLRAYNKFNSIKVTESLQKFLEIVHEIVFTIILTERKANIVEKRFPEFALKINNYTNEKELLLLLDNLFIEIEKFRNSENLNYTSVDLNEVDLISNNINGNMILFLIEYRSNGSHNLALKSLEHILPQNPNEKNWPIIKGLPFSDLENSIFSLGNFLLIDQPLNSRLKAAKFSEKQIGYSNKIIDPVPNTSKYHVSNLNGFDFDIIKERTKLVLAEFKKGT
jgi:hypothetical protein